LAWLWSLTPATPSNFPAKHPNSKTPWSCQLYGAVVQISVEFWSTSFAAPKPPNMNQVVELKCNYPPLPSVTQKNDSLLYSSAPRLRAAISSPRRPSSLRQGRLPSAGAHPPRRQGRLPDTGAHLAIAGVRFSATRALPLLHRIPSSPRPPPHRRSAAGVWPITEATLPECNLSPEPSLPFVRLHHAATRHTRLSTCFRPQSARPSVPTPRGHQALSGKLAEPAVSNVGRSTWLLSKLVDPRQLPLLSLSSPPSHSTSLCPKRSPLPMAASPSRVPSSPAVAPPPRRPLPSVPSTGGVSVDLWWLRSFAPEESKQRATGRKNQAQESSGAPASVLCSGVWEKQRG
jgi:hypothetical protein